jgi:uncharacterized protein YggU (UPF0235/DUF167 family)
MVKVQPKSRQIGILGTAPSVDGPRLRIGVSDPPEDGRANRAVCTLLARVLDVPAAAVAVAAGAGSREKRLTVAGDPAALARRLESL